MVDIIVSKFTEYIVAAKDEVYLIEENDGYSLTLDIERATTFGSYKSALLWTSELDITDTYIIELETITVGRKLL
jgi:hypothetical protein